MRCRPSSSVIRHQAIQLLTERLLSGGYVIEPAPHGFRADLLARQAGRSHLIKVLAAAAPHHRGGTGSLGLHWLLTETAADLVALVDLSRSRVWLLATHDFRSKAQALSGGRYHLDWIVVPIGSRRNRVAVEEQFDRYRLTADRSQRQRFVSRDTGRDC
jgi:hypothetical protein